jgi:hypothetical protein
VRLDSTVTAALLHEPSDSSLLWDAVCVMVRHIGFYGEAPRQTAADGGFASRPEGGRRSREGGGRSRGPSAFAPLSARWMVE